MPYRHERKCEPKTWNQRNVEVLMWNGTVLKGGDKDMVMPVWGHIGCWTTRLSSAPVYEYGGSQLVVLLVGETTRQLCFIRQSFTIDESLRQA